MDIDIQALRMLERERDISFEVLASAIEQALSSLLIATSLEAHEPFVGFALIPS